MCLARNACPLLTRLVIQRQIELIQSGGLDASLLLDQCAIKFHHASQFERENHFL